MVPHRSLLARKLAEIDQLIAQAYQVGEDASLKTWELFSVCDSIESLEQSRRDVEEDLNK